MNTLNKSENYFTNQTAHASGKETTPALNSDRVRERRAFFSEASMNEADLIIRQIEAANRKRSRLNRIVDLVCYSTVIIGIVLFILCMAGVVHAYSNDQIANAIYKAENSVKYPYGIKSIPTYGDTAYARKICLNTIRNNRVRFTKQTRYSDFIEFLGSRYCPPSVHSLNRYWVKNVKYFLEVI